MKHETKEDLDFEPDEEDGNDEAKGDNSDKTDTGKTWLDNVAVRVSTDDVSGTSSQNEEDNDSILDATKLKDLSMVPMLNVLDNDRDTVTDADEEHERSVVFRKVGDDNEKFAEGDDNENEESLGIQPNKFVNMAGNTIMC